MGLKTDDKKKKAGPASSLPRSQLMKEWTRAAQAVIASTYDWNPDDLVQTRGGNVAVYKDMLRDPYVKAALNIKKYSVIKLPTKLMPASAEPEAQRVKEFVQFVLKDMDTSFEALLYGMMDALDVGYSISEVIWKKIKYGDWAGKIGVEAVHGKDPEYYAFDIDDFANIHQVVSRWAHLDARGKADGSDGQESAWDPRKFLIYSNQPRYNNPYGTSDLRSCHRAFFIKDWAWKFRAIYMEKWGMPTLMGMFPKGTTEDRRKKLEQVLESIQNETVVTIPDDLKIEILRIAAEGRTTEYERSIYDLNKEILIGILFSFLSVEESRKTGSRAAGQVHERVMEINFEQLANSIADTLNRKLIRPLVDLNFETHGEYPELVYEITDYDRTKAMLEIDKGLHDLGVTLPQSYYYSAYKRPQPETQAPMPVSDDQRLTPDPKQPRIPSDQIPDPVQGPGQEETASNVPGPDSGGTNNGNGHAG
jgi:phage gp29-like protein